MSFASVFSALTPTQWLATALWAITVFVWLALRASRDHTHRYQATTLLSPADEQVYARLIKAMPDGWMCMPKVAMSSILEPQPAHPSRWRWLARLRQKNIAAAELCLHNLVVDFALCTPTLEVACVVLIDPVGAPGQSAPPALRQRQRMLSTAGVPTVHVCADELASGLRSAAALRTDILAASDMNHPASVLSMLTRR